VGSHAIVAEGRRTAFSLSGSFRIIERKFSLVDYPLLSTSVFSSDVISLLRLDQSELDPEMVDPGPNNC
jgi:hypothetical protein